MCLPELLYLRISNHLGPEVLLASREKAAVKTPVGSLLGSDAARVNGHVTTMLKRTLGLDITLIKLTSAMDIT